jgi:hypothetical protein
LAGQHAAERVDRRTDQRARLRVGQLADEAFEHLLEAMRELAHGHELHRAGDTGKGVRGTLEVFRHRLALDELQLRGGEMGEMAPRLLEKDPVERRRERHAADVDGLLLRPGGCDRFGRSGCCSVAPRAPTPSRSG